jgi:hypothetical protein
MMDDSKLKGIKAPMKEGIEALMLETRCRMTGVG